MNTKRVTINELLIDLLIYSSTVLTIGVNACNVNMCSREYSPVLEVSPQQWSAMASRGSTAQYCALLNAYQQCLRSLGRSCRGNLEFHTWQTLLKNWKHDRNCSQMAIQAPVKIPNSPSVRSGLPLNQHWQQQTQHNIVIQQERLQLCLSSAYNYTINTNHSNIASIRPSDQRTKLLSSEQKSSRDDELKVTSRGGHKSRGRHRSGRSPLSDITMKYQNFPIKGEPFDPNLYEESNSNTMPSTVATVKPSVPPSPPLTCIIYGDPHLRTFNNEYQTCRCSGAWPLIDHPLFAVQITNSKIKSSSPQITGVTKVTVLVRQFTKCGIHTDMLYEADSQSNPVGQPWSGPTATFIDGSTSNANNLIRISQSSNNNVITVHLDHIGVRVYIGQFGNSAYLNVVIKFRSSSTVKQQLVLNSISSNSLCKTGCPKRELIDIEDILSATGIDVNANSDQQSDNSDNTVNDYKSDPTVMDANEDTVVDEEEVPEEPSPCRDLYGYYRISCLYDVTIKGVKDVNNANRFAQSFDEMNSILNSRLKDANQSNDNIVANSANSSQLSFNHCLEIHIFLIFVTTLTTHLL